DIREAGHSCSPCRARLGTEYARRRQCNLFASGSTSSACIHQRRIVQRPMGRGTHQIMFRVYDGIIRENCLPRSWSKGRTRARTRS
ncbi:hypothetical protein FRC00_012363, partial [Tulasnella sp. 408]